ncbi:glycosyltransferase [Paenibacillus algorifonticola]|uniref:CgeB family protein n=1 Tax=Paenibacillus algorifonticola TaxID=684063 RepID=UPI003D2914CF
MVARKNNSRKQVRQSGYETGFHTGWRDGACEALSGLLPSPELTPVPMRMLYIPQGFEAIDTGLIEALQASVTELHVGSAEQLAEQAAAISPDIVLVMNGLHTFPANHLQQIGEVKQRGFRTAVWFVDDPYMTEKTVAAAPHYDIVLTHELGTLELYRSIGCTNVHYLPLAVHAGLYRPQRSNSAFASDVCFIGQGFWNRIGLIDAISERLLAKRRKIFLSGGLWERLAVYKRLQPFIHTDWLSAKQTIPYYNNAKIVINIHRTTEAGSDNFNALQSPGRSINPRTYEIAACGAFQLTDIREDLPYYYTAGQEIETFQDAEELAAKIDFYLENEEARSRIAVNGLRRTLRDHTFRSRAVQLLQLIMREGESNG